MQQHAMCANKALTLQAASPHQPCKIGKCADIRAQGMLAANSVRTVDVPSRARSVASPASQRAGCAAFEADSSLGDADDSFPAEEAAALGGAM